MLAGTPLTLKDVQARESVAPKVSLVQRLRDSHHRVAQLLAEGHRPFDVSAITGYSASHLSQLQADPAFCELVQHYRDNAQAQHIVMHERLEALGQDAIQELHSRLHSPGGEELSTAQIIEISKLALDRSGYGPIKTVNQTTLQATITPEQLARIRAQAQPAGTIKRIGQHAIPSPSAAADPQSPPVPIVAGEAPVHSPVEAPRGESNGPAVPAPTGGEDEDGVRS